ncbi:hypothetical protein Mal64_09230 [Pseudobythopirellula maris]|uniref:Uncharacterized protein n=1 Tax=Pseudobythopirellula maris TaxID=2527991 RepID=A0A5C5ZUE9_9BACT|nr:hypothetical protein Mal64_09230 [Pseudobythopirellula maris]
MWPFPKKIQIENIETESGNAILKALLQDGWRVTSEYSDQMFDKGIDFDAYTLKHGSDRIDMEWDNWFEWKITASESVASDLAARFSVLKKTTT